MPRITYAACVIVVLFILAALQLGTVAAQSQDGRGLVLNPEDRRRSVRSVIEHHSFTPPLLRAYYGDGEIPHWELSGSTVATDKYVRLTPDASSMVGHMWNTEPLDLHAFEITMGIRVFRMNGGVGADGMALWLTTERPRFNGPIFGRPMDFVGIGILFDTYDNDNKRDNPMVSVIYNRPEDHHRKYTPERDFFGEYLGSCLYDFRRYSNYVTVRVRYVENMLSVYLARGLAEELCVQLDNIDLDVQSRDYFLGLTAETGGVSENHDVVFMHVSPIDGQTYKDDIHRPQHEERRDAFEQVIPDGTPQHVPSPPPQHREQQQQHVPPPPPPQQQQAPPPPQHQEQQQQHVPSPPPQHQEQQHVPPPPPPQQQQHQQAPPPPQHQEQQQQHVPPPPPPQQQQQQQAPPPPQHQEQQHAPPPPQQHQEQQAPPHHNQYQQQQQYYQGYPSPPPQQQQQYQQPPPDQQQYYQQHQQQQQYYQQPPPPPPPQQNERQRLEELERELAVLRRQAAEDHERARTNR